MSSSIGNIEWTENLVKKMLQLLKENINPRAIIYNLRVNRCQSFQRILKKLLPMCPQLTVTDIMIKYNKLSQEFDDWKQRLEILNTYMDVKSHLPYWYDDMSYLKRYFSDTKMESKEDDQQPGGSAKRFKSEERTDVKENNPNSDSDEDVILVSEHPVPPVPKEERSKRGKYSPGVDALGELVKDEMESISDPHHRKQFRNKILQAIINNKKK